MEQKREDDIIMDISVFRTQPKNEWPDVRTGQTVKVSYKIKEGERERIQVEREGEVVISR